MYYSQYSQDKFISSVIFPNKRKGFFLDIGAHDGVSLSNTLFFEKEVQWDGICFEPNSKVFLELEKNRNCSKYNCCVGDDNKTVMFWEIEGEDEMYSGVYEFYHKEHLERIERENKKTNASIETKEVNMITLNSIEKLKEMNVDYLSLDTEGNEFLILKSINFNQINISTISVEDNYGDPRIGEILVKNNFIHVIKLGCDDIFIQKDLLNYRIILIAFYWKYSFRLKVFLYKKKRKIKRGISKLYK